MSSFASIVPDVNVSYENASGKFSITFDNKVGANHAKLDFVAQGVVVDKSESLISKVFDSVEHTYEYTWKQGYASKLQLGKGFVEGRRTKASEDYTASAQAIAGKAIVIRPYVIVKVAGTDTQVTIYGDPVCYTEKQQEL